MNIEKGSKLIVSYGGGTNSTAMIIGLYRNNIMPDHILFADTGGERQHTYNYISYFNKWLRKVSMPEIETLSYKNKYGNLLTLEQDVINNKTLPSIAFGFKTCSQKFKIYPQEKFIKELYPQRKITHLIGFDAGEQRRVKENPLVNNKNLYPLIEWGWDRNKCKNVILNEGLCLPGKSSCFFCPNMKKHEILDLTDEEKERVKFMESNSKNKVELKGLGRSFSWTDLLNADQNQQKLFDDLDMYQSPCECID